MQHKTVKTCATCLQTKNLSGWFSGPKCGACYNKQLRKVDPAYAQRQLQSKRESYKKYKEIQLEKNRQYRNANREKLNAAAREKSKKPQSKFTALKCSAKRKKLDCKISWPDYLDIITDAKCYYCEGTLAVTGHSLDRVDNSIGYIVGNVVACCSPCNYTKSSDFSCEEFLQIIPLLQNLRQTKDVWTNYRKDKNK